MRRTVFVTAGLILASLCTSAVYAARSSGLVARAERLLELIKLVDGEGSGLDADTWRGLTPAQLLSAAQQLGTQPDALALVQKSQALEERVVALEVTIQACRASNRESEGSANDPDGSSLDDRVGHLEALLAPLSMVHGGQTLRFSGVNVQIVSGGGSTYGTPNGFGNLIVGYDESRGECDLQSSPTCDYPVERGCGSEDESDCHDDRFGSHNIVVGAGNDYEGVGALVTGKFNAADGQDSVVLGGARNAAIGRGAVIIGGEKSTAVGSFSLVAGGRKNYALGNFSVVEGGQLNRSLGRASVVLGGSGNTAAADDAVVVGGQ